MLSACASEKDFSSSQSPKEALPLSAGNLLAMMAQAKLLVQLCEISIQSVGASNTNNCNDNY